MAAVMDNYIEGWKKWNDFAGKTSRPGFWWFLLINIIVGVLCSAVSPVIGGIYNLVSFVPNLAITIRRLHDVNKSGWWCAPVFIWSAAISLLAVTAGKIPLAGLLGLLVGVFGGLVAFVFAIILLVFLVQKGS